MDARKINTKRSLLSNIEKNDNVESEAFEEVLFRDKWVSLYESKNINNNEIYN